MNRDRGTIKWNALMLPEHVKLLREWQEEDKRRDKPLLEEWMLDEMNTRLQQALKFHLPVTLTYWMNEQMHSITGKINQYNETNQKLVFSTGDIVFISQLLNVEIEPTL